MPNIKPVSDLRNYTEVLRDIAVGEPVFLTKNGRGRYVLLGMEDYEKIQAGIRLAAELAKERNAGEKQDWKTIEDVEAVLGIIP
jgi:prevent-host-death family protein